MKTIKTFRKRLEYLRGELRAERISLGEISELQSLAKHIAPGDVELLEAAGVPEHAAQHTPGPCQICGAVHSPSAMDAAGVLLDGKARIKTAYGSKTACGVASLIDNETHAPELLDALEALTSTARTFRNVPKNQQAWTSIDDAALNAAFAAIAHAKGQL